ncbi:class I SAM-dependent methyltransferase [Aestuariispira ectoiniformans]|uniref:class I SAM-dependent methyltransferase n=1 Tax=Aestuariispira ectoiniformans TaxID=2775080 RepID=UPI00223B9681|nr:class I SAM-dependent methyltransferase [Aestuariispira ectoiniformans]
MSRLDSVIRRLEAQRACLNRACEAIAGHPGVVLELGLGNGRTYDHLRQQLPDREIFVFERCVNAHPDCIPDDDHLFLGDLKETLAQATGRFAGQVAMIHSDIGTGDPDRNARFAAWLGEAIAPLLAPGAIVLSDQDLTALDDYRQPLPPGVQEGRYFFYRRA